MSAPAFVIMACVSLWSNKPLQMKCERVWAKHCRPDVYAADCSTKAAKEFRAYLESKK